MRSWVSGRLVNPPHVLRKVDLVYHYPGFCLRPHSRCPWSKYSTSADSSPRGMRSIAFVCLLRGCDSFLFTFFCLLFFVPFLPMVLGVLALVLAGASPVNNGGLSGWCAHRDTHYCTIFFSCSLCTHTGCCVFASALNC